VEDSSSHRGIAQRHLHLALASDGVSEVTTNALTGHLGNGTSFSVRTCQVQPCQAERHAQVFHLRKERRFCRDLFTGQNYLAYIYFGTVDGYSEDVILRPASVYSPKKRIVAIASKETGTHIPFSVANCIVR
jgi:hypothetical protein